MMNSHQLSVVGWRFTMFQYGGFLSHRATPSHHPFRTMGDFPVHKNPPAIYWGTPMAQESPTCFIISLNPWVSYIRCPGFVQGTNDPGSSCKRPLDDCIDHPQRNGHCCPQRLFEVGMWKSKGLDIAWNSYHTWIFIILEYYSWNVGKTMP